MLYLEHIRVTISLL